MLRQYLDAALEEAKYEIIEDEEPFYGAIPELNGVWATGTTLEGCRRNLQAALEDWVIFSLQRGAALPLVRGLTIEPPLSNPPDLSDHHSSAGSDAA